MAPADRSGHRQGAGPDDGSSCAAPWDLVQGYRHSRSVVVGLTMVGCFGSSQRLGIAELAEQLGLSQSTTHRYAATFQALGWFEQTRERKYRLAHRSAGPGMAVLGAIALATGCEPVLRDLRAQTGHTVSLGVLDGERVIYVQRFSAHGRGQYEADGGLRAGAHVPLHCTALGHALLASLPEEELDDVLRTLVLTSHTRRSTTSKRRLLEAIKGARVSGFAVSDREFFGSECTLAVAVSGRPAGMRLAVEVNAPAGMLSIGGWVESTRLVLQAAVEQIGRASSSTDAMFRISDRH